MRSQRMIVALRESVVRFGDEGGRDRPSNAWNRHHEREISSYRAVRCLTIHNSYTFQLGVHPFSQVFSLLM